MLSITKRNWVGFIVAAAVVAGLIASALPSAAADDWADDRLHAKHERFAELRALRAAGSDDDHRTFTQAESSACFTDPAGDTVNLSTGQAENFPRADLLEYCVDYGRTAIRLATRTAEPRNPATDLNWRRGVTFAGWGLDTTGNGQEDYSVLYIAEEGGAILWGAFEVATDDLACAGDGRFDGTSYIVPDLPAACIGVPASIGTIAVVVYDSNYADEDAPLYADAAPESGWHGPVAREAPEQPAPPPPPPTAERQASRLAGPDRFATAVEISRYQFPQGADEVYLARADNFPDALAGGSLTRGPVLLVPQCGAVPQVVLDEIRRLSPARVVALGGTGAVCDAVLEAARGA